MYKEINHVIFLTVIQSRQVPSHIILYIAPRINYLLVTVLLHNRVITMLPSSHFATLVPHSLLYHLAYETQQNTISYFIY